MTFSTDLSTANHNGTKRPAVRRFRRVLFAMVFLAIGGVSLWHFVLRGDSLLNEAHLMPLLPGETLDELTNAVWLSPHTHLILRYHANLPSVESGDFEVLQCDTRNSHITSLPRLARKRPANTTEWLALDSISPDGQWLLWGLRDHTDDQIYAVRLDGKSVRQPTMNGGEQDYGANWTGKPHELVKTRSVFVDGVGLQARSLLFVDIDHPDSGRQVSIAAPMRFPTNNQMLLLPNERLVTYDYEPSGPPQADIGAWQIGQKAITMTASHMVHFPRGASVLFGLPSPNGRRFVWQTQTESSSTFSAWLNHYIPYFPASRMEETLWVCNADGTNLHSLGRLPVNPNYRYDRVAENLRWLPDNGKDETLGFRYKGQYYTLAVR